MHPELRKQDPACVVAGCNAAEFRIRLLLLAARRLQNFLHFFKTFIRKKARKQ